MTDRMIFDGSNVLPDVQVLKSLEAGSGTDSAAFTGGRSLQLYSLYNSVINAATNMKEFKLFNMLSKQKVGSTVHNWVRRDSHGAGYGGVVDENSFSAETNQTLQNFTATMKTISRKRGVTFQMAMAQTIEDPKAAEKLSGILEVMEIAEHLLYNGDRAIVSQEFDGLKKLIPSTNVIDIRGKQISDTEGEAAIETGARIIRELGRGAVGDTLLCSPSVMQDLQNLQKDRTRYPIIMQQNGNAPYNVIIDQYRTPFGSFAMHDDLFINDVVNPVVSTLPGKPSVPVLGSITAGGTGSQFAAGDAGTYYYQVQGVDNTGGGDVVTSAVVTVAAGESVTIPITTPAGVVPQGYAIYRSQKNATSAADCRLVGRIANTAFPAGTTVNFVDDNSNLPGCHDVYLLTTNPAYDALKWLDFIEISEFPLGTINQAVYAFLVIMVGALGVYVPKRHVRIKNVEPIGLSWY